MYLPTKKDRGLYLKKHIQSAVAAKTTPVMIQGLFLALGKDAGRIISSLILPARESIIP